LPKKISGGMKQRVALARVLILEPAVLLMDEPFAALDAQTRGEMQSLLLHLWTQLGHTVLFVTHDVQEAVLLADRILLMQKLPGSIREEIAVTIERPRKINMDGVMALTDSLLDKIRE
jgi:NitT/TauT family transport system ATP-binding protein